MLNELLKHKNVLVFGVAIKEYAKGTASAFDFPVIIVEETDDRFVVMRG